MHAHRVTAFAFVPRVPAVRTRTRVSDPARIDQTLTVSAIGGSQRARRAFDLERPRPRRSELAVTSLFAMRGPMRARNASGRARALQAASGRGAFRAAFREAFMLGHLELLRFWRKPASSRWASSKARLATGGGLGSFFFFHVHVRIYLPTLRNPIICAPRPFQINPECMSTTLPNRPTCFRNCCRSKSIRL